MNSRETIVEKLVAFALGELGTADTAEFEAHLARTPSDRGLFERVRGVLETLKTDDTAEPDRALVDRVKSRFGEIVGQPTPGLLERVKEIIATLVFDSRVAPAIAGFRGAPSGYQLAFSSDVADVDLQVVAPETRGEPIFTIRGQVSSPASGATSPAVLTRPGETAPVATGAVDARGLFCIKTPPGTFDLRFALPDALLTVPSLQIE